MALDFKKFLKKKQKKLFWLNNLLLMFTWQWPCSCAGVRRRKNIYAAAVRSRQGSTAHSSVARRARSS